MRCGGWHRQAPVIEFSGHRGLWFQAEAEFQAETEAYFELAPGGVWPGV
jgi:hypothetical protein